MIKKILSVIISAATVVSFIPQVPAKAEEIERYPYTIFASSYDEGAITIDADTICVNGNIAANGTVDANENMCINGSLIDEADESMIFIFDKIDQKYFSSSNVKEHEQDYDLNETNINIDIPTYVQGETTLTGNVNINTALKSLHSFWSDIFIKRKTAYPTHVNTWIWICCFCVYVTIKALHNWLKSQKVTSSLYKT